MAHKCLGPCTNALTQNSMMIWTRFIQFNSYGTERTSSK